MRQAGEKIIAIHVAHTAIWHAEMTICEQIQVTLIADVEVYVTQWKAVHQFCVQKAHSKESSVALLSRLNDLILFDPFAFCFESI
ncbi:hypothetical protein Plhal304r1_c010g0038081 [Plasmopara halstedii]